MALRSKPSSRIDRALGDLLEGCACEARSATALLHELLAGFPEGAGLVAEIAARKAESARACEEIARLLARSRSGVRWPWRARAAAGLERASALASPLGEIASQAERVAAGLEVYGVEAALEQAVELSDVLRAAAQAVAGAVRELRSGGPSGAASAEARRLAARGERIERDAVASLFAGGADPLVVISWKDLLGALGAALAACEQAARIVASMVPGG